MAKEVEYKPFTFRYQLEPYKGRDSRFTCPQCGKKNTFARYVDVTTGEYADDDCGRCNVFTEEIILLFLNRVI